MHIGLNVGCPPGCPAILFHPDGASARAGAQPNVAGAAIVTIRGVRDAVDVGSCSTPLRVRTNKSVADGDVVWSWCRGKAKRCATS